MPKIIIDTDKCLGCGMCEDVLSDVVGSGVITVDLEKKRDREIQEVADSCPYKAIRVE